MNAKHTPGPWYVWESDDNLLSVGHGHVGTQICNFFDENGEAYPCAESNSRLIAAAPELLSIAKRVSDWERKYPPKRIYSESQTRVIAAEMTAIANDAAAAIAKAEGGAG